MPKGYKNRQMETEPLDSEKVYFFPKNNPPVSIKAKTRIDAEKKLKAINNKDHE